MKRINSHLLKRLQSLLLVGAAVCSIGAQASEGALPYSFEPDTGNIASQQRGARNFMNYCSGCHSMGHLRYARMAADLGIPEDLLKKNLMFTSEKPGDHIVSAMPAASAGWFGAAPPDLTVETRMRGADWVYNYLMTFYLDSTRPLGSNNLVLPGASMPHVLGDLQGWQVKHEEPAAAEGEGGHGAHAGPGFKIVVPGKLDEKEYQKFVADTVNFMVYAAEPGRAGRVSTGIKVMLFLLVFTVLAYMLKREYWKDVH